MRFASVVGSFVVVSVCLAAAGCGGGGSAGTGAAPLPMAGEQSVARTTDAAATTAGVPTTSTALPRIQRLRGYNVDPDKVFVAGISSGGFFGVQMGVAHSRTFKGMAIYAGGVYYCALDSVVTALTFCGGEGLYESSLAESEAYLDQQSKAGTIDDEQNLRREPVYLWSGTADTVVKQAEMNDLQTELEHYGARIVRYDNAFPAEHGWESPDGELACGTAAEPYMIACDLGKRVYDSEQVWLGAFFGPLRARNGGKLDGQLINFDQTEFGAGATNSMDTNGYAFVPRECAQGRRCGVVLALHGCLQTQSDIGTKFVTESGIDEWADTNGIIVVYPYAIKSATVPYNPQGCWDWWGYDNAGTDTAYSTKNGVQIGIVYKMVERVLGR